MAFKAYTKNMAEHPAWPIPGVTTVSAKQKQQAVVDLIVGSRAATTVPFSALIDSPYNVRRGEPQNIEGMAQSIRSAGGIMQNLIVHEVKAKRGNKVSYGVCAGRRRKAGYGLLVQRGEASADAPINVVIVTDAEARLMSLMENTAREDMHLADVCEGIRDLHADGRTLEHIAEVFSVSVLTVQRRLKLAHLSPMLFEAFRKDDIELGQLQALALCPDPAEQERIWAEVKDGPAWMQAPAKLREIITRAEVSSEHALARFVGIEAYEAAGGEVRRDLFSDTGSGYLASPDILNGLVRAKLDEAADALRADGWSWVEADLKANYETIYACTRLSAGTRVLSADEQAERDALEARVSRASEALEAAYDSDDESIDGDALEAEVQAAEEALEAFDERSREWTAEQKAVSGVYIAVAQNGGLLAEFGLVKRADMKAAGQALGAQAPGALQRAAQAPEQVKPLHSESLCARLTAHRTAVVRLELSRRPEIALVTLLARMVPDVLPGHFGRDTRGMLCIQSESSSRKLANVADDMVDSPAWIAYDERAEFWRTRISNEASGDLFGWLMAQTGDTVRDLFAFCVAATVDGVSHSDHPHVVNRLADVLNVDYRTYWKATGASYFQHVPKARILDVVKEATTPETAASLDKLKKAELVGAAERAVSETGWLPEVLRNREQPEIWQSTDDEEEEEEEEEAEADDVTANE
ncbi:ParB/RepB/Spo0J family partition protein [Burkholderia cepacia]|uniref:ParB/RepB/Spo0J family partition protein n=1 Tax=Burkholderia cepacia TaxID=292 RepID=UPI001CF177F8|nr:ParB/RepB/Spo0J family partition protein [Burkholderia cepacia]MCA8325967.1 ParB N-terminal domain-containing protein [Burkholderia cepacia]